MDYFRCVSQPAEQGNRRAAKEREPFEIIYVAINLTAREIVRCFNQIGGRVQRVTLPDTNLRTFAAPLNLKILYESAAEETAVNLIVKRGDEKGIGACGVQGLG
jgi:hypothetical protein